MVSEGFSGNFSASDPSRDSWYRAVSTPMEKERKWSKFAKNPVQNDTVSEFQLLFILEVADRWGDIGEGFEVVYHCFSEWFGGSLSLPLLPSAILEPSLGAEGVTEGLTQLPEKRVKTIQNLAKPSSTRYRTKGGTWAVSRKAFREFVDPCRKF
jgi:hypothetical protein